MAGPEIKIGVTFYYVGDLQKAKGVYSRFLGVEPVYADEDWARYEITGGSLALHYLPELKEIEEIKQERGGAVLSLTVSDIQSTLARAKASGFRQVREVDERPFGKLSSIQDPWGNRISLLEPADEK
ncbi:MAG: VOC family protein [Chloroflexi bacterium]|nr:VOC family protein [Chloroflexota bacterium]